MRLVKRTLGQLVTETVKLLLQALFVLVIFVALLLSPLAELVLWSRGRPRRIAPPPRPRERGIICSKCNTGPCICPKEAP